MSKCMLCNKSFLIKDAEGICPECLDGENKEQENMIPWNPEWDEEEDW